ncbi:MAG: hypothetical protein ABJB11_15250 [Ferruginibacter sp.]
MRTPTVKYYFVPLTDKNFAVAAGHILQCMKGNVAFPSPSPALPQLTALLAAYSAAIVAANNGDRLQIAIKKAARNQLQQQLSRLALYVMQVADGSETILISSGFPLAKKPERLSIEQPGAVTLCNGITSGQLISCIKAVKGAKCYTHEIAESETPDNAQWKGYSSSRRKFTFNNLVPGRKYWVRVAALGTGEQMAYSALGYQWAQ